MKLTSDIVIGKSYKCFVRRKWTVVTVLEIDKSGYKKHSTARIICLDENTNKQVIVRAPSRLAELK